MHGLLRVLLGGLMAFRLAAALPVFEPFQHAAGLPLNGLATPEGLTWGRIGAGADAQGTTATENLTSPGWPASSGGLVQLSPGAAGGGSRLPLGITQTNGVLYYSFLLKVSNAAPVVAPSAIAAFDPLTTGIPSATELFGRLLIRSNAGGFNLGMGRNTSANAQASWAPNLFTTNDTILVIAAYEFTAVNHRAYLWLNPSSGTFGAGAPPAATVTNNNGTTVVASLASLSFPMTAGSPSLALLDEVRVAASWAEVTSYAGPGPGGPFVERFLSHAVNNYTGTLLDSDDDAVRPGAVYDREAIRVETRFSLQNTNATPQEKTYKLSYRLFDPSGAAQPIRAFGSATANSSNTYDPTIVVTVPAGVTTNLTNIAFVRPTTRLAPATAYAVECRLFRDTTVFTGFSTSDIPRLYFHHTNIVSVDSAANVLTRLDSLTPTRDFALRLGGDSLKAFQAQATVTLSRYDRYLAASAGSASVPVIFQLELRDTLGNSNVPLRTALVSSNIPLAEWTNTPTRNVPWQQLHSQVLDFEPASGIQLDSVAGRYQYRVTVAHNNAITGGPDVVAGNRVDSTTRGLLHFNGELKAGTSVAVFTNIVNTPVNLGANAPGINTSVAFGTGGGGFLGSTLRFGSATPANVRLRVDGSADLLSTIPLTGGTSGSNTLQRIAFNATAPTFGPAGLVSTITLTYPSGFGCREGNLNQPFSLGTVVFPNTPISPVTLAPSGPVTANAASGQKWYFHEESKPVWFEATGITWNPTAGTLSIVPTAVTHVRKPAYSDPAIIVGGSGYRPSNDRYWEFVSAVTSPDVKITADLLGRALATFSVSFATEGSFEAHFPAKTILGWGGGGSLSVSNDLPIPAISKFNTVSNTVIDYLVGCRDCGLVVIGSIGDTDPREMAFGTGLRVTVDGGLTGEGTTPVPAGQPNSIRDLGWGKSDGNFTHLVERVNEGRFHMPGNFLTPRSLAVTPSVAALVEPRDLPGILLLTGVDAASGNAVARALGSVTNKNDELLVLGTAGYMSGAGEYAGMNYTPTNKLGGALDPRAISRLAGQETQFDPSPREKLYLRRSGVTGIHEAAGAVTLDNIYGYEFSVSNLSLSFMGSQNEASGLVGDIVLPYPANFTYRMEGITLRCNGHFDGAPRSPSGLVINLDYWNTPLIVNGIAFEPPTVGGSGIPFLPDCDSDDYTLVFDVSYKPLNQFFLGDYDAFTGRVAINNDGNIVGAGAGVAGVDSRLIGPTTLELNGSNGDKYPFEPVVGGYFNLWKAEYDDDVAPGWFNLVGTLNVAFFQDLKVHMHVSPNSLLGEVNMMGGWPATGFTTESAYWEVGGNHFFNDADFDATHEGAPGVGYVTYRDATTENYNPRAQKLWATIVKFDYPLVWSSAAKEFVGLEPKEKNLIVLKTFSRLDHLRAANADISFGAQYSAIPIANLTEMLLEGTGLNDALNEAVGAQLSYLDKGIGRLSDILDSDPHKYWDPILDQILDPVLNDLYAELEAEYARVEPCQFATAARPILDRYIGGAQNQANSVSNKLATIAGIYTDAASVLGQTYKWLGDVELAIDAAIDKVPADATLGQDAGEDAARVVGMFTEEIIDAAYKPRRKSKEMATDILAFVLGKAADAATQALIEELLEGEDIPLDEIGATLAELRVAIGEIRAQLKPAAQYATQMAAILNGLSSDIVIITNLATEDTVDYLESFACGIDDPFLDVAEDAFKNQLKEFIKERFYETGIPAAVQGFLKELLYDLNALFVDAANSAIAALNRVLEQVLTDATVGALGEAANESASMLGDIASALGSGKITGDAHIVGDNLTDLRLDMEMEFGFNGDRENPEEGSMMKLATAMHIKSLNNEGDDGTCSAGSTPATEVTVNILVQPAAFLTDDFRIQADFLFAFSNDPSADPPFRVLQLGGGFEVPVYIPLIPGLITLKNIGGDASFGKFEDYLSANCDIDVLELVTVTGGLFIGKTCDYKPFDRWAPDVQNLIKIGPNGWAGIYSETSAHVGIGDSCVLRAGYGGGIGFGMSWDDPAVLGRMYGYVDGDFLCFIHGGANFELAARGDLGDALSGDLFGALWFKGCAGIEVKIIFTVTENVCVIYEDGKFTSE